MATRRRPAADPDTQPDQPDPVIHTAVLTPLADLRPHPRNYRQHPPDQIAHLKQSLTEHGAYRNIVATDDGVILAGHGITLAALELGWTHYPVARLPIAPDHPKAMKILAADNTLSLFAFDDDRMLTDLLRDIKELDTLYGTGYDESSLAAAVMTTRTAREIESLDTAAEWVGMPEFTAPGPAPTLVLSFDDDDARDEFIREHEIHVIGKLRQTWSAPWPPRGKTDRHAVEFGAPV